MKKNRRKKSKVTILVTLATAVAILAVLFSPTEYSPGYEYGLTNLVGNHKQATVLAEIERSFETPYSAETAMESHRVETEPAEGEVLGVTVRIPRFGDGYAEPLFEGTTAATLSLGVAHYIGTAMPGEVGNFSITAHRTTYGANFFHINDLISGDEVSIETIDAIYHYRVDGHVIVDEGPSTSVILEPVPEVAGLVYAKDGKYFTMSSCHPWYDDDQRYVVFGHLESIQLK